jgi:hypothetical protein
VPDPVGRAGTAAVLWGLLGVGLLFLSAVLSLGARGSALIRSGLQPVEWLLLAAITAAFVYGEGVRALQRRYVPFLLRRLRQLRGERAPALHRVLAPLYAMALIAAPPRALVRAWAGLLAIVAAVLVVRALPEPWRGLIDTGVAAALAWGLVALLREGWTELRRTVDPAALPVDAGRRANR